MRDEEQRNRVAMAKKENLVVCDSSAQFYFKVPKMSKRSERASSGNPTIVARVYVPPGNPEPLLTTKELTGNHAIAESLAETGPMALDLLRRGNCCSP